MLNYQREKFGSPTVDHKAFAFNGSNLQNQGQSGSMFAVQQPVLKHKRDDPEIGTLAVRNSQREKS